MPNIHYRLPKDTDLEALLTMMAEFNAIDQYPFDRELAKRNLLHFINDPALGRVWLIEEQGYAIGYIVLALGFSFEYGGRDAFIDELFVKKDHRGKGVGSQAIDFIIGNAKKLGVKAVHLEVEKHNERGNKLYLAKKFKPADRILMTRKVDQ